MFKKTAQLVRDGFPYIFKIINLSLELHKVFASRLQLETPLLDDRELCWFADEHLEGVKVLVEGAKGHPVAVEVQEQPETTFLSTLRQHCVIGSAALHTLDQRLVLRRPESILPVESAAHAGVSGNPGEQAGAVDLLAGNLAGDKHVFWHALT